MGRARQVAFFTWAAVLSLVFGLLFVGVTALTIGTWLGNPGYAETNPVVDLGFFALGAIIVGTGIASQLWTPERRIAGLQQAVIGLLALAFTGMLGDRVEPFWGGLLFLLAVALLVALHPARKEFFRGGSGLSAPLAAGALLGAIPAFAYSASMIGLARMAGPSCFLGQCATGDRFAEVAGLAIAVASVGLLAAVRTNGWRLPAWSTGLAAVSVGVASIALPGVSGTLGLGGGVLAVAWGLLFVATAEWTAGRS